MSLLKEIEVYLRPTSIRMFFLGFSSGLPLLLVLGTLSFWLREAGVDLKTIGFLSWIGLVYGFKWVWAPIVDRVPIPFFSRVLGRRRAWLFISQIGITCSLLGMAFTNPGVDLRITAFFSLLTAFFSATQDIALDAYRIESAENRQQGILAAMYQTGYRLAMIWAGAGALAVASFATSSSGYDPRAWSVAYLTMSASVGVGVLTTLFSPEPVRNEKDSENCHVSLRERVREYVINPFRDFFWRFGKGAIIVLLLIATYRISDIVMGVMANPFYSDMGFTKEEVAAITKIFGVVMTLLGAFVGGIVILRLGVLQTMMIGAVLSSMTNLLFVLLSRVGHDLLFLTVTISTDNFAAGLASSAFVAYLSGLTNANYSATQYALFSSIMLLLPKFLAGFSGVVVEETGYDGFFILTAVMGIPVFVLVGLVHRFVKETRHS